MKLLHIADLHIGKRVNGMSMIEEQTNVIAQLVTIARDENVAGVLIAGDVFDRPVPSREALETCESLFSGFCEAGIEVFAIPGNHDAPQQLSFCSALLASSGLHIAKAFDGHIDSFDLARGAECVRIHLLPFVRPTDVRMALPDAAASIASHDDAVRAALARDDLDPDACNVLVAHQFVTANGCQPETCDSEVVSVGGTDNVDVSAFDSYDYVALGHLHGAQAVREQIFHINLECAVPLIQRCPAIRQHQHAVFRRKAQQTRFISEHHTLDGGVFIFQGKVAVAAFVMARKVGNLAADDEVIQWFALLQHLFSQQVQGGYIDVFGHALISLAARMDTPMALSLANLPGTK